MGTIIESMINAFVGAINGFISGIDGVIGTINRIPGVRLGYLSTLGSVHIPRLAQGAVIPPNKEFMAVLGDQTNGNNIETPEALLRQIIAEGQEDQISAMMAGFEANLGVLREILEAILGIHIGDDVIAAAMNRYQTKMSIIKG